MNWLAVLALVMVIGQAVIAWVLARAVRSFGQFTEVLSAAHKSNMLVHESNAHLAKRVDLACDEIILARHLQSDRAATFVNIDREEKSA